jgi:hypothetical protein
MLPSPYMSSPNLPIPSCCPVLPRFPILPTVLFSLSYLSLQLFCPPSPSCPASLPCLFNCPVFPRSYCLSSCPVLLHFPVLSLPLSCLPLVFMSSRCPVLLHFPFPASSSYNPPSVLSSLSLLVLPSAMCFTFLSCLIVLSSLSFPVLPAVLSSFTFLSSLVVLSLSVFSDLVSIEMLFFLRLLCPVIIVLQYCCCGTYIFEGFCIGCLLLVFVRH